MVEEHASSAHEGLVYNTGITSKHQRAMWPELCRKLIVFLRIVVWHMRVSACLLHVWGCSAGCCDYIKNAAKTHFYFKFLKFASRILWQPTDEDVAYMSSCHR